MEVFIIALVALFSSASNIDCVDRYDSFFLYKTGRFNDIAQAINFMQPYLPINISSDEMCRRYAVLSDVALEERLPYKSTVLRIAKLDKDDLDKHYEQLDSGRISWLYMCAIDRYRLTQLAPPIIALVECLRQVDNDGARKYLKNQELIITIDLYKQVLGIPSETMTDIESLDFTKFYPTFRETLRNLFSKYFDVDSIIGHASPVPSRAKSSDYKQARRELFRSRRREQSRLTQQRMRLVRSDVMKKYQDDRRERLREQRNILNQPVNNFEELEARRLALQKRALRNEKQRIRRRELRQRRRLMQRQRQREESNEAESDPSFDDRLQMLVGQQERPQVVRLQPMPSEEASQSLPATDPLGSYDPYVYRPFSSNSIPDSAPSNNEMPENLVESLLDLYHSLSADTGLQHLCRNDNTLNEETSGRQVQWDELKSSLSSWEPNSQEEHQFRQELMECAARWDNSDSIIGFLLDEPQTSGASDSLANKSKKYD